MILYKAPYRVSLFGGGSDYPSYLNKNDIGMCIGFAIDKYSYISVRELPPFFPYKTRLSYSEIETVTDNSQIKHNGIKNAIDALNIMDYPLEINHTSDLPTKTGLGTSSAFLVALSAALYDLKNNQRPLSSFLGEIASSIEQRYANVGMQDHYFSAFGNLGELAFHSDKKVSYATYSNDVKNMIEEYGILLYTGINRDASKVVGEYIDKLPTDPNQEKIFDIATQVSLAISRNKIDLQKMGQFLNETWESKKLINTNISNTKIDNIYYNVIDLGAYGGKLCGAGSGGCLFFLAPKEKHDQIKAYCIVNGCFDIPFKVSLDGCKRIL